MTERVQSNFVSGVLDSAWFIKARGSSRQLCRTTGFSLLADLKANIISVLASTGALPTTGGTTIAAQQVVPLDIDSRTGVITGDGWTLDTLRGLYAIARRHNVPSEYTNSIQNDLQIARFRPGRPLSVATMQAAIWLAEESGVETTELVDGESLPVTHWGAAGSPAEVSIGDAAVLPNFGSMPEAPSNHLYVAGATCVPYTQSTGAQAPLHARSGFAISDLLIIAGLFGIAVGAAVLTTGAPTRAEQREARRNPFREMPPATRRYAISQRSREQLIAFLKSHDPCGLYEDDERIQAGMYPLTHTSASKLVHQMVS